MQGFKIDGSCVAVMAWLAAPNGVAQNQPIRALQMQANPETVSLHQAVAASLSQNEDLEIAQENLNQQHFAAWEAWSFVLPTWTVNGQKQFNAKEQTMEFQTVEQLENQALLYDAMAEMMEQNAAVLPDPAAQADLRDQADGLRDVL